MGTGRKMAVSVRHCGICDGELHDFSTHTAQVPAWVLQLTTGELYTAACCLHAFCTLHQQLLLPSVLAQSI